MSVKKHLKTQKGAKIRSASSVLPQWLREPSSAVFPSKGELVKLIIILGIAASVSIACNRVVNFLNRQPRPFCDSSSHAILPYESDGCDPCPDHGVCTDSVLYCDHGYKEYRRRCLEDSEINQTSKKFSDRVEHLVCEAYASLLCKGTDKIWFTEADISAMLENIKLEVNADIKDEAFYLAKQIVLNSIQSSMDTRMSIDGYKEFKCPKWLAEYNRPFICVFRQWMHNHMPLIFCAFTMFLGFIMFSLKVHQEKRLSARAEQLYAQICLILEEHSFHLHTSKSKDEAFVVFSWLRDHLLLPSERKNFLLWKKVEDLIQEDSRIDQYPKLINGEAKIVLEWQTL